MSIAGKITLIVISSLLALVARAETGAANNREARLLHKVHCTACHTPMVYTRKKRVVRNYPDLVKQIRSCNHMLSKNFSAQQINGLAQYLNTNYYKFR